MVSETAGSEGGETTDTEAVTPIAEDSEYEEE
jgi:hypothetical protein